MGDAKARDRASLLTKYKNLMTKSKNLRICKCNDQENDKKNNAFKVLLYAEVEVYRCLVQIQDGQRAP